MFDRTSKKVWVWQGMAENHKWTNQTLFHDFFLFFFTLLKIAVVAILVFITLDFQITSGS